eukprot:scaffold14951_cov60-Phaeocystis_antarctica.AAC.2
MVSSKKVASSTYIVYETMVFSNLATHLHHVPPTAYRLPLVFSGLLQAGDRVHLQHDLRALPARAAAGGPHAGLVRGRWRRHAVALHDGGGRHGLPPRAANAALLHSHAPLEGTARGGDLSVAARQTVEAAALPVCTALRIDPQGALALPGLRATLSARLPDHGSAALLRVRMLQGRTQDVVPHAIFLLPPSCSLLTACCLLLTAYCLLLTAYC